MSLWQIQSIQRSEQSFQEEYIVREETSKYGFNQMEYWMQSESETHCIVIHTYENPHNAQIIFKAKKLVKIFHILKFT